MFTAIYTRQSIDKKDSISIETQIDLCQRELSPDESFKIYSDKGFSGKNTNRPEFQKMIDAVKAGEINRIVIYRLDRISRSISDFASIMDILEEHNVSFTSVNEKFDTSTPMGRAMLYIIMIFAQLERETIAERIKDNYYQRGKTGVWLGGPAPFGFKIEKVAIDGKKVSRLKPTKDLSVIKYIFNEYASTNKSLGQLAKSLVATYGNKYGIWNNVKLSRILHNPIYVKADADIYEHFKELGCIMINNIEEYDGIHSVALYGKRDRGANKYNALDAHVASLSLTEGIIDSDIFIRCQNKLSENKQIKNTGKGKYTWMTGLMKCGYCGYSMTVKLFDNKKYLYCSGHQNQHICPNENIKTLFLDSVENIAEDIIYNYLKKVDRSKPAQKSGEDNSKINNIKIEIYKINEQINNLIEKLIDAEGATIDYINKKVNELDQEKQKLMDELKNFTSEKIKIDIPTPEEWQNADIDGKRNIAHLIAKTIKITNDNVKIDWTY